MFLKHDASSSVNPSAQRRRGRLLLLTLAAMIAVPAGMTSLSLLRAQEAPAPILAAETLQQPIGNKDRLTRGIDAFKKGQYEEALADLQQVNAELLGEPDRKELADYLAKADAASNQRRSARAEFEMGEQALAGNKPADAVGHYRAAMNNRFADEGTKAKSREQLALAESMLRKSGESLKDVYNSAVADYRAGEIDSAKSKFEQLQAAGFRAGLFQKSPADYVKDIDRQIAARPSPEPIVVRPEPSPQPAEVIAPVAEAPAPPVVAEPSPQPAPEPPAVAETPAPAPVVEAPVVEAPVVEAPVVEAPVVETPVVEAVAPPVAGVNAKEAYQTALRQYRLGDWIAARKNFELARDNGYRPGLFEQSPQQYLTRMDAKESRDAQLAAEQAQQPGAMTAQDTQAPAVDTAKVEAAELVTKAEEARAAGRLDEAMALYSRAVDLDASNSAAVAGRDQLAQTLGRTTGQVDVLAQREQQIMQQRQFINYSLQSALDEAARLQGTNDFEAAQKSIERARLAKGQNPGIFRDEELREMEQKIAAAQLNLDQARESYRLAKAADAQREAEATVRQGEMIRAQETQNTVKDLIRQSRQLTSDGKYKQAVAVLDQILLLDPQNDYARGAKPLVEDRALLMEQKEYRDRYNRQAVRQYTAAEEAKVPYSDILTFPTNWPDLSEKREKTVAIERGERAEDQAVIAQLDRKLPEVRFDNVGFADVIEFLRDVSAANIFVNWRALEASGIDRNAPVTARLRDVKFSKALETILRDVGGGTIPLGYTIDEGVITISTLEDLASNVVTRVYDIRDLIINIQDFTDAPDFQLSQSSTVGGGGGGSSLFGGSGGSENEQGGTRQELVDSIVSLIQDTVSSESWKDNGGSIGSIRELSGQLIVTQTPENQRELTRLLEQLRETRAIQITVEARFLTVQRNFLEEIGVDFDVLVPSGQLWSQVGTIAVSNNSIAYTQLGALSTSVPGNIATELTGTGSSTGGVTPNFGIGNGLGGAVTFLDDFQVSLLIRATQIAQNSTTLTAPRLTLFNGQRAFVTVATETAYVSDLTPIVGTNAVAFDPQVGLVQSGVLLDVQATVSADRKYVTLTLRPTLSRLRALVPFPVSALSAGGGDNPNVVNQTAFLQQPVRDVTQIRTSVSVPDGGTLLLGGQTLAGEIERESGVPVLSKIPFLKRLFTNTSNAKDEQVLLILVKPTIVIQREIESDNFPTLSVKSGG